TGFRARFAGVLYPGETIRTRIWRGEGELIIGASVVERDNAPVLADVRLPFQGRAFRLRAAGVVLRGAGGFLVRARVRRESRAGSRCRSGFGCAAGCRRGRPEPGRTTRASHPGR